MADLNPRAERLREFRVIIERAKAKPCADCEIEYPSYVMDFDHVRGKKEFNISKAIKHTWKVEVLEAEIAKCDVVCSNCHRERTHGNSN